MKYGYCNDCKLRNDCPEKKCYRGSHYEKDTEDEV